MPSLNTHSFSPSGQQALHIASQLAKENMHATYGAPHLLKALLHKDLPILKFLESKGADVYYLEEWAEIRIEQYPRTAKPTDNPAADDGCEAIFNEAEHLQSKLQYHSIEPECLLIATSTPGVSFSYEQLKTYPLSSAQVLQWYENGVKNNGAKATVDTGGGGTILPLQHLGQLKHYQNTVLINWLKRKAVSCGLLSDEIRR